MSDITVKKLAKSMGIPVKRLIRQLKQNDIVVVGENDLISGQQQLSFIKEIKAQEKESGTASGITLETIQNAKDLDELNDLLTKLMVKQQIQPLIKGEKLSDVVDIIIDLVSTAEEKYELVAAAMLGRLAAVARGRESIIFDRADEVFSCEPASIETLEDGDAKLYAATFIKHVSSAWQLSYIAKESIHIDTADKARRELLGASLAQVDSIASWLKMTNEHSLELKKISNPEGRLKRVRRITGSMGDVIYRWQGDVGENVGAELADLMKGLLNFKLAELDQDVLFDVFDNLLSILGRVIELRFSSALYAKTYELIAEGKRKLGPGIWGSFLSQSKLMPSLRVALSEAALVLARQNKPDKHILAVLVASYTSRPQVSAALRRHFDDKHDLDPDTAKWWCSAGEGSEKQRNVEHKVGNTEDAQIGALLLEVESNSDAMDKVGRVAVRFLKISDPVLASTVEKAVNGYKDIAQRSRRLARMRKLTKTDIKGERLEYNRSEHEMLGEHKQGVRQVKVIRDGIKKDFSGTIKTIVKPWVVPEEE